MNTLDYILRVLTITAHYDIRGELSWRTDGPYGPVRFWIDCGDVFWWGTADCEELTPENVGELERACADVVFAGDRVCIHGGTLFCCRVRKMRPQGAVYRKLPEELWPLFDACGPERDPKEPGNTRRA
jgi:hypothetical protein